MALETKNCENAKATQLASTPLEALLFFQALRPRTKELLKREGRVLDLPRGYIVFMHEDKASWFYFLESGCVKLFRETLNGDEAILDVLPSGCVFGETSCLEKGIYSYSAEIIEDCRLISFPLSVLEKEIKENNAFTTAFLHHVAAKFLAKDKEIELRSVQNAAQRIGCFLLRLCKGGQENSKTLHLSWEKSLIAARIGMTPETFSRSLARLQKDVGLRINGPTIEIPDIGALVRYTCTACSNVFPCEH